MTIKEVYAFLNHYGKKIGREAANGDKSCRLVMKLYVLHYNAPVDSRLENSLIGAVESLRKKRRRW